MSNLNFGTANFSNTIDPDILQGWGVRPSDWNWSVSLQQEVLPRVSVEVGFYHREFFGFAVTDNLAHAASDYTAFSVTAPQDRGCPAAAATRWGTSTTSTTRALFGVTRNYVTYRTATATLTRSSTAWM